MNYYPNEKNDSTDYESLFGHSFEMNNMNTNDNYLSQSMPIYYNQSFDNSQGMFDNMDFLNLNQDDFTLSDNLDPSIFLEANQNTNNDNGDVLDLETQQAILLSDPTFIRQQQLLQEEQQRFQQQQQPIRSNLSAMLENSNNSNPTTMQPIPLISSHQQKRNILDSTKNAKPIPISSSSSPSIDHQRRFNELQARFRISKKPKQTNNALGTSMPTTTTTTTTTTHSSSYTDRRRLSLEPVSRINKEGGGKIKINTTSTNNDSLAAPSSFPSRTMPIQIQRVHRANGLQNHDLEQRQKKLDDQLIKTDFDDITVSELKEMLRQRGKPATGKKAVLLQRLIEERDLIQHARANNIPILNRYIQQSPVVSSSPISHAGSLPDSMYLSSSSPSIIGSLNRSIADMHIGSPPMTNQQSRRFAPYSTSPRTAPLSNANYSASVPTTSSLDMMMMQQQQQQKEPVRVRNIKKSYAPFTSSALATPDRDDDINPFDTVKEEEEEATIKQELTPNDMEWTDPTLDFMLQNGNV